MNPSLREKEEEGGQTTKNRVVVVEQRVVRHYSLAIYVTN
jgi:hypothetical protein